MRTMSVGDDITLARSDRLLGKDVDLIPHEKGALVASTAARDDKTKKMETELFEMLKKKLISVSGYDG